MTVAKLSSTEKCVVYLYHKQLQKNCNNTWLVEYVRKAVIASKLKV